MTLNPESSSSSGRGGPVLGSAPAEPGSSATRRGSGSRLARIGSGLLCILGVVALGFLLGGFLGGRVFGGGGMGWDKIADTLGGAVIGIVSGLGVSVWAIRGFSPSRQTALGIGSLLLSAAVFAVIRALAP